MVDFRVSFLRPPLGSVKQSNLLRPFLLLHRTRCYAFLGLVAGSALRGASCLLQDWAFLRSLGWDCSCFGETCNRTLRHSFSAIATAEAFSNCRSPASKNVNL